MCWLPFSILGTWSLHLETRWIRQSQGTRHPSFTLMQLQNSSSKGSPYACNCILAIQSFVPLARHVYSIQTPIVTLAAISRTSSYEVWQSSLIKNPNKAWTSYGAGCSQQVQFSGIGGLAVCPHHCHTGGGYSKDPRPCGRCEQQRCSS